MRVKEFETGLSCQKTVNNLLNDVKKSKKKKAAGEEYKTAKEMCEEYSIDMETLKKTIQAKEDADSLEGGKFLLSGKSWTLENGNIARFYSRAGELMVQCIEDAYKDELRFDVPISGEYLVGRTWGDSH